MRDFKQEATDYCEVLDNEDDTNRGDGDDGDVNEVYDLVDRSRKESEEFHQLEAHFRGRTFSWPSSSVLSSRYIPPPVFSRVHATL